MKVRRLPLNPELEYAALGAVMSGKLSLDQVAVEELSKYGQCVHKALSGLDLHGPVSAKAVFVAGSDLHGADPAELKAYLKDVASHVMPEVGALLDALHRKKTINDLVNEASDQIASGDYSLLGLKTLIDTHASPKNQLVPLLAAMNDAAPPKGIHIPSLPTFNDWLNGLYGVWIVQGEPAAGKSTLALQVSLSITQQRPVLYYDYEQGADVIKWHVHQAFSGNRKKIEQYTSRLYVRPSLSSLERDLEMLGEPALIVVDSIQKVAKSVTYRRESLESWIHKLEALKRYEHHVIMVSEKNRAHYGTASIDGGKETGELEYAGDAMFDLMLVDPQDSSLVEVHVTKNRHYHRKGMMVRLRRVNSWRFEEDSRGREID